MLEPATSRLPPKRVQDRFKYKAYCQGVQQGAGKPSIYHRGVDGRGRYSKEQVGQYPHTETNRQGRKGCKPKGFYKEVPRPSRRLALAATKRSLTKIPNIIYNIIAIKQINKDTHYILTSILTYNFTKPKNNIVIPTIFINKIAYYHNNYIHIQ